VERDKLISLCRKINTVPQGFTVHPKLDAILKKRLVSVEGGNGIDWANAESLAFATLLVEGLPVRLSGQDSRRGTFSQRHSVLVDIKTGERYAPLANLEKNQGPYYVFDSMLAEASVLSFEYGYSMAQPRALIMWEAQFGDFVNNSQTVIDVYLVSGESKWQRLSGLVLLLPHGLEGLGPEHSSARPERFLQLCAGDNIQVCNPTTPAQYFHLLRHQVKNDFRKPLVILTPKSLLRHPLAVSRIDEMVSGFFEQVLDDPDEIKAPQRVLFCSGKIFYELYQRRADLKDKKTAIIRVEQFYPFAAEKVKALVTKYRKAKQWCWVQEEAENMGGWSFMRPRLESIIDRPVAYVGRKPASSPATGFPNIYRQDQEAIISQAIGPALGK
jgi:2-oxoglutarate dehydrogenase E1 component